MNHEVVKAAHPWNTALTKAVKACLVVSTFVFTYGCSKKAVEWTEEVRFADGESVLIHNSSRYDIRSPPADPGAMFAEEVRVTILAQTPPSPPWSDKFDPILLARDPASKEFLLVVTTGDGAVWQQRGRPQPPYWQFRLTNGTWKEESVSGFLIGQRSNLLLNPFWSEEMQGVITPEQKKALRIKYPVSIKKIKIDGSYRMGAR